MLCWLWSFEHVLSNKLRYFSFIHASLDLFFGIVLKRFSIFFNEIQGSSFVKENRWIVRSLEINVLFSNTEACSFPSLLHHHNNSQCIDAPQQTDFVLNQFCWVSQGSFSKGVVNLSKTFTWCIPAHIGCSATLCSALHFHTTHCTVHVTEIHISFMSLLIVHTEDGYASQLVLYGRTSDTAVVTIGRTLQK